ncbi:MAG: FixH family protein [Acidobacteria bacterium]|nr:FixH family protein [Acidobacteriota bacterium]
MTRWGRTPLPCALLLALALLAAACGRQASDPAPPRGGQTTAARTTAPDGQGLSVAFRSDPDPPRSSRNTFDVTVTQPDGTPVTDATVTAVFSMPAMPR